MLNLNLNIISPMKCRVNEKQIYEGTRRERNTKKDDKTRKYWKILTRRLMKVVVEGFHFWETELYRNQFLSGNCWERVFVSQRCLRKFHLHKTHSVTFNECDTKLVLRAASSWLELYFRECSELFPCVLGTIMIY